MVSKKILGVAIAAAFSSQAFAVVDLDATTPVKPVFAKETFLTGDKSTVSSVDYYTVVGAANILDITSKMGVGMNTSQKMFVRVDVANALFATAPSLASLVGGAISSATIAQGGSGSSYVVFEVTAGATKVQADTVTVTVPDLKLNSNFTGTAYTFTVYETLTAAVNNGTSLYAKSLAGAVTVASGLKQSLTSTTATADVEAAFKKFTSGATLAAAGKIDVSVDAATFNRAGTTTVLADIATAGALKITGDFSLTGAGSAYEMSASTACTVGTAVTVDSGKAFATTTFAVAAAKPYLCITIPTAADKVIPESAYNAALTYTAVTNAAFAPAVFSGKMGEVVRNGTTVQVPYLTTFADYNQRLVLVNRGSADVAYSITFTPDVATGATATAGAAATGTLKAGKTTVLKATDVVTIAGSTRTAATVAIVSAAANIDAATTTIN